MTTAVEQREQLIAERADERAHLVKMVANERGKLPAAQQRVEAAQREAERLRPTVETLTKWARAGDPEAKLRLPQAAEKLDKLDGQSRSWAGGIREINCRIVNFEAAIERHDAVKVDHASRDELVDALAVIDDERKAGVQAEIKRRDQHRGMFAAQAEAAAKMLPWNRPAGEA